MAEKILREEAHVEDKVIGMLDKSKFLGLDKESAERIVPFLIALAIGVSKGERKELKAGKGVIRRSAISQDVFFAFQVICLTELIQNSQEYDKLDDINEIFKVVEEYANVGFYEMEKYLVKYDGERIREGDDIWDTLDILDKKYKQLSTDSDW